MQLDVVLAKLNLSQARDPVAPHWEASMALLGDGVPAFLTPEAVRTARRYGGFESSVFPWPWRPVDLVPVVDFQ